MSCSLRSCGFGQVKKRSSKNIHVCTSKCKCKYCPNKKKGHKCSDKCMCIKRSNKIKRRSISRTRKNKSRKNKSRKSRKFGFKYLRNDQIIKLVNNDYPNNLTCDRA